MSNGWNYAFSPPPTEQVQDEPDFDIDVFLDCDFCGELMEVEEESVYLLVGKVGRGSKSGRLMVVPCPDRGVEADLHVDCVRPWLGLEEVDEERLCVACENKLDGED